MSYRSRYKYRQPFFKTVNPHDKTPKRFDVRNYLKDEFFNCDDIIFRRIADLYCKLYGVGAHNYMMKTFYSWKSGYIGISGQTFSRILECVPKFLSDEKRFFILKCEVVYFLDTIHFNQQSKSKEAGLEDIQRLFVNYLSEIEKFDKSNLSWFLGKDIFSDTELDQFLSACKYAIKRKLNLSCRQVFNDLTLIKLKLIQFDIRNHFGTYRIDFLNSVIDIDQIKTKAILDFNFDSSQIKLDGFLKQFAERYIVDELLKIDHSDKTGKANAFIKSKDLDTLLDHYKQAAGGKNQIKITSSFQGEGGLLYISLSHTSFNSMFQSATIASVKIMALIFCEAVFLYLWIVLKSAWGFFLGFYGGLFILGLIYKEATKINNSILEYRNNG